MDSYVERAWNDSCLPTLKTYITIPNVSPCYDSEWATNGFQVWIRELSCAASPWPPLLYCVSSLFLSIPLALRVISHGVLCPPPSCALFLCCRETGPSL